MSYFRVLLISIITWMSFFCSTTLNGIEAPSEKKIAMSFYILEQSLSLDNRSCNDLKRNELLLPLAESTVTSALNFYPDNLEYKMSAIRTLYVQGNYYLRTEKFTQSLEKLYLAKKLCEDSLTNLEDKSAEEICELLTAFHPTLPALYSLVLHHIGQIPLYYKESPVNMNQAEKYLKKAFEIRRIIDNTPNRFANVPDNNTEIGDAAIFKRTLGYVYLQSDDRLDEAESLYLDLLSIDDPYNQLISHRQLFKIYQRKGQSASEENEKIAFYKKSMDAAKCCLEIIEQKVGPYTRISSVYKDIGILYGDDQNPFQDIKESYRILELAKLHCGEKLQFTSQYVREELGITLKKLSLKELEEAVKLRWLATERENTEALKLLNDLDLHLLSYERLGDLYLEKNSFILASALYSNGLSLASKCHDTSKIQQRFYQKLNLTEQLFLKYHNKDAKQIDSAAYEDMIRDYKISLESLREQTRQLLDRDESIEIIYTVIGNRYKNILRDILEDLFPLLGAPPTEDYAFIGFGSLGRGFVTPYSDLEFAILLKDECNKPYFKMLSELFHIRINALGESPIAAFNLASMSWLKEENGPSGRGLMLDPWNVVPHIPIYEKFDLIGTPRHLASVFEPYCTQLDARKKSVFYTYTHIFGNPALVKEYQEEVDQVLASCNNREQLAKEIIWSDLDYYYKYLGHWLEQKQSYSLKRDFYRPFTTILDALALKQGFHVVSPWQIINMLYVNHYIDEGLKDALQKCMDDIGKARLKAVLLYGKQNHTIYPKSFESTNESDKYYEEEQKLLDLLHTLIPFQKEITSK